MAEYFGKFPQIPYAISKSDQSTINFALVTDIMVRVRVLTEKLNQIFHYYEYTIKEDETPEILANKIYGDPETHWLIMMTNNITDPQFDWPLSYDVFNQYLINKYGSIPNAQTTIHHYEKIYKTVDTYTRIETDNIFQIEPNPISNLMVTNAGAGYSNGYLSFANNYGSGANVSYLVNANGSIISITINSGGEYIGAPNVFINQANTAMINISSFVATGNLWTSLPTDQGSPTSQIVGNSVVDSYPPIRSSVSNYDWEFERNEAKRHIKLIKPEYLAIIQAEFNSIMAAAKNELNTPGIRTLN